MSSCFFFAKEMNWENYATSFENAALSNNFDASYVKRCLAYGKVLFDKSLPIIYSLDHLANLVGYDSEFIVAVSFRQNGYYRNFFIPKKSGDYREISEPLPSLKIIQRWITENILYRISASRFAKAFVPTRSIKDNARFHKNQKLVLTVDIKDFFLSLSSKLVYKFFLGCGYSKRVSYFLTRLTTLNGSLPQGAPSSPYLSNLLFSESDEEISTFSRSEAIRYTRYADDLTFSGDFSPCKIITRVRRVLGKLDLRINEKKTRVMKPHQRQIVTGIVVNNKLQAVREIRRNLRQNIHYIEKFGFEYHVARIREHRANYQFHLMGQANFILFINPRDKDAIFALEVLRKNLQHSANSESQHDNN
ncbi:reverse transcriptase family protein [Janthinobacterium lividum]|nr:reverse transcriptase family protein [Janthinobacterium lividum]